MDMGRLNVKGAWVETKEPGQVIVAGWMDWQPGDRASALEQFALLSGPSRDEPGCVDYVICADPLLPDRIRIYEHWVDGASLDAHLALPHVAAFRDAIKDLVRTGRSVQRYVIASTGPVR
jgi:quinol monooxygenase YgiN